MKKLTTQPYISELSTLTALFSRILTFAVITKNIPTIADIRSYSFSFTNIDYRQGAVPVTAIMFFSQNSIPRRLRHSGSINGLTTPLRSPRCTFHWLKFRGHVMNVIADTKNGKQDDEAKKPLSAPRLKKLREQELVLWSTFDWDRTSETATVWMRKDFVEKMKADREWNCCLMITDLWFMQSAFQPVGKVIAEGRRWVDEG